MAALCAVGRRGAFAAGLSLPRVAQTRALCKDAEYRGPGGLTATQVFAKVQEARLRDGDRAQANKSAARTVEQLTVKELLEVLRPHSSDAELKGIREKEELVRRARLILALQRHAREEPKQRP
jgi:hypothetical protein